MADLSRLQLIVVADNVTPISFSLERIADVARVWTSMNPLITSVSCTLLTIYCIVSFNFHRSNLSDPRGKERYISRLQDPIYIGQYRHALAYGLSFMDRVFGKGRFWQGYLLCTEVSFSYCLFGFLWVWAFGGPGRIGNSILLSETWEIDDRIEYASLLSVTCVVLYLIAAYPLYPLQLIRNRLRRTIAIPIDVRTNIALISVVTVLLLIYAATSDILLPALYFIAVLVIGIWLASMVFFGGALFGWVAAVFSGFGGTEDHSFLGAIAILAAVALGGSTGARVAVLALMRHYQQLPLNYRRGSVWLRNERVVRRIAPGLVYSIVGAVGGGAFVAAGGRGYEYMIGPEVDIQLLKSLEITSHSQWITVAGAIAGFVGGALANILGKGAVALSGFVCSLLLIGALSSRALAAAKLSVIFGSSSLVGYALINLLLFFIILPPINALWDWLAWEGCRVLGHNLYKKISPRALILNGLWAFALGMIFLFGLTVSATWVITQFNKWMMLSTHTIPLSINDLVKAAVDSPLSVEGLWLTIMLFSTLIPSFFYFVFVVVGVLMVRTPMRWRSYIVRRIQVATTPAEVDLPVLYFMFLPLVGISVVVSITWLSVVIFARVVSPISHLLFVVVRSVAT
jgi:hypothetical protein